MKASADGIAVMVWVGWSGVNCGESKIFNTEDTGGIQRKGAAFLRVWRRDAGATNFGAAQFKDSDYFFFLPVASGAAPGILKSQTE